MHAVETNRSSILLPVVDAQYCMTEKIKATVVGVMFVREADCIYVFYKYHGRNYLNHESHSMPARAFELHFSGLFKTINDTAIAA